MKYFMLALQQYANFNGRANRPQYWYFVLFQFIFLIVAAILDNVSGLNFAPASYGFIYLLVVVALILPGLAVSVRRLHDLNKSGWYILLSLIPLIGGIWLLVLMVSKGTDGPNQYGPDPNGDVTFDFESTPAKA
jgi:uncharacterized membrane protein YhaH (DUF805 family)